MRRRSYKIAQIIKSTGIGIGAVLVGLALVMHASQPASASTNESFNFEDDASLEQLRALPVTSGGKYQMAITAVTLNEKVHWYTLVWNTETGKSKIYYANPTDGMRAGHDDYNLPSSPL